MKHRSRAGGIAAASLALAATTASAGPSVASTAAAVPVADLAAHATAWIAEDRTMDFIVSANAGAEPAGPVARDVPAAMTTVVHRDSAVSLEARRAIRALVQAHAATSVPDAERECLAGAVYFEAQGEPIEGQLAVAEVVLNRAASGEYPSSICEVVTQPAQFSFVRDGRFPAIDRSSDAWRKAVAVAHIAAEDLAGTLSSDVLWYHADYVAPSWGRRLHRATRIGAHIFYRRG